MTCTTHHYACDCREARFKELYIAINKLLIKIGSEGEATSQDPETNNVMSALYDLDEGEFDVNKVFL